jgi:c-di-GMP-related signal transduction protein
MECFVARQPIFDRQLRVFAYELLFRSGFENSYGTADGDKASADVLTASFLLSGLDDLTRGKKASINFTRRLILEEVATLFPNTELLIEIDKATELDDAVIRACKHLKRANYSLVFDGFTLEDLGSPLVDLVDIVKVDFSETGEQERISIPRELRSKNVRLLAKKMETVGEFNRALEWDYSLFQGYFFSRPIIQASQAIGGSKVVYLRILSEIAKPQFDLGEIENLIRQDISLSYKLLRFINSAYFGLFHEITSIRQALTLVGIREIKKWIALTAISDLAADKPEELVVNSLVRAKFLELLAPKIGLADRTSEFFLLGMFSAIDAIVGMSMTEILGKLPLGDEIKVTLLGGASSFRDAYDALMSYERGQWDKFADSVSNLRLTEDDAPGLYRDSVRWVNQTLQIMPSRGDGAPATPVTKG